MASRFSTRIAGTRSAEKTKTDKYKFLCQQLGIDFVLIIFTTSGGMGEQFQRQYWNRGDSSGLGPVSEGPTWAHHPSYTTSCYYFSFCTNRYPTRTVEAATLLLSQLGRAAQRRDGAQGSMRRILESSPSPSAGSGRSRPGNAQFSFPRFPMWPGNGEGIPDSESRFGRNRESGNRDPPIPDSAGNGKRGPDWAQIGKSGTPCRHCVSAAGTILGWMLPRVLQMQILPSPRLPFQPPRIGLNRG